MPTQSDRVPGTRSRGRPRVAIDSDAVADAVAELFEEGGYEAVTVINTARKLSVSRATLYRAVPTKQGLLGILFERSTRELTDDLTAILAEVSDPADQLRQLIALQAGAAVKMRGYMPVFFGGADLPADVYSRWHAWSRRFEKLWVEVVAANIERGSLSGGDPVVTTRLILGMIVWISRWYRPRENISALEIAETAGRLLGLEAPPARRGRRRSAP